MERSQSLVERRPFLVGPWRVEPALNRVVAAGDVVQLEPRVMGVLLCLADHAGEVVARETLLATVWADVIVGDDPLNRAVSTLRRVFGDDAGDPAYVETIRKVGYRLIAPVEPAGPDDRPAPYQGDGAFAPADPAPAEGLPRREASAATRSLRPSVAVTVVAGTVLVLGGLWAARPTTPEARGGLQPVPLTSEPGHEVDPAFSPDGSRLAYAWDSGAGDYDLYARTVAAAPPLRLTSGPAQDRDPAWSPDGQVIAFVRRHGDDCALLQVPALGGIERPLAGCVAAVDLAWGPGGLVAFADRPTLAAPYRLYLLDPATGAARALTDPPATSEGDRYPTFAPDGRTVAFVRSLTVGLDQLHTVPVGGGAPARRSDEPQRIRHLAWPVPDALVYASDWDGVFGLYRRALAGGAARWLAGGGDGVRHPTAHGGRVVYEEWEWDKNVWAHPVMAAAPAPAPMIASTRWDHSPHVGPDGDRVVFVSNRTGSYELWLWERSTGRSIALTDFGGPVVGRPRWAPDGRRVAFDVRTAGRANVYVLDVEGGRLRPLTASPTSDVNVSWSPDGRWLYFGSNRSGAWEVWRAPAEGGPAEQVTRAGGYVPEVSPDGRWLYYTKAHAEGLWRRPLDGPTGAAEQRVFGDLRLSDSRNWAVARRGIYAVTRGPGAADDPEADAHLVLLDPASGAVTAIGRPSRPVANLGLAVTPDEALLLYVQVDRSGADLMLVEE